MVFMDITCKLQGTGIKLIRIPEEYEWRFNIACGFCKENHDKIISFSSSDEVEMGSKGHGVANFRMTCKNCEKVMTIGLEKAKSSFEYNIEDGQAEIAKFECRGCTLVKWHPEPLIVESESGFVFNDVDVTENWCGYDENTKDSCLIEEPLESTIN
jgi:hypothetical protein